MTRATPVRQPQTPQTPPPEDTRFSSADPWADLGRKHAHLAQAGWQPKPKQGGRAV